MDDLTPNVVNKIVGVRIGVPSLRCTSPSSGFLDCLQCPPSLMCILFINIKMLTHLSLIRGRPGRIGRISGCWLIATWLVFVILTW